MFVLLQPKRLYVISPRLPKSIIIDNATENGGDTIGIIAIKLKSLLPPIFRCDVQYAKRNPIAVASTLTITARNRVFIRAVYVALIVKIFLYAVIDTFPLVSTKLCFTTSRSGQTTNTHSPIITATVTMAITGSRNVFFVIFI